MSFFIPIFVTRLLLGNKFFCYSCVFIQKYGKNSVKSVLNNNV